MSGKTAILSLILGGFLTFYAGVSDALPDRYLHLLKTAESEGGVRVIVNLKGMESTSSSSGMATSGRAGPSIERAHTRLMQRMERHSPRSIKRFRKFPLAAMEVSAAGLEELKSLLGAEAIIEDRVLGPNLSESVPLTGAAAVSGGGHDGTDTVVAILDTGVDSTHAMFREKIVAEACFSTTSVSNNSTTVCPNDLESQIGAGAGVHCLPSVGGCDHGTHVAGIAAGRSATLSGVARGADIISVQVYSRFDGSICNSFGMVPPCALSYTSDQIQGLEHVLGKVDDYPIAAINLSLGGGRYSSADTCDTDPDNAPYRNAVEQLRSAGIATIAAAGNDGYTDAVNFPACMSSVIDVGSTTISDSVVQSSNSAPWLSLLAPGDDITSARPGGGYQVKSGTSMAAPHVAGSWAVLKSKWPAASVDEILSSLQVNGTLVDDQRAAFSLPRIQLDEAIFEYSQLSPGLNQVGVDVRESDILNTFELLPRLGSRSDVVRMQSLDTQAQWLNTTYYDDGGSVAGSNTPLTTNGQGRLVYASRTRLVRNDNHHDCPPVQLDPGVNLVAFPCTRFGRTSYDILEEVAPSVEAATVQTFDSVSGRTATAMLSQSGIPVGVDFPIENAKSYIVQIDGTAWVSPD